VQNYSVNMRNYRHWINFGFTNSFTPQFFLFVCSKHSGEWQTHLCLLVTSGKVVCSCVWECIPTWSAGVKCLVWEVCSLLYVGIRGFDTDAGSPEDVSTMKTFFHAT